MTEPTGAPRWVMHVREYKHPYGIRSAIVYAQNQYYDRGFERAIVSHVILSFVGFGYEKRLLRTLQDCSQWCEKENALWMKEAEA